ncbi:MAG: Heavy metal efflux outer membrane protein CzcC family [Myxococcaceae bacterium]|nr:Heavy metal efflux outer membrane protein CzcC family [Myxococcaceae bacterium]
MLSRGDAKLRRVMSANRVCPSGLLVMAAIASFTSFTSFTLTARVARADEEPPPTAAPPGAQVLSLTDAVALARTRGYDVLLASAAVRAAEAEVRIAGQTPNPAISGGPSRRVDCFSGNCPTPWGAFATLSDQGLIEGAVTRKRKLRADVARRALEASKFGRANAERVVVAQVKTQYIQTAAARARVDLAREVAASLQKSVDINRVRYPRVIDEGQLARVEQEGLRAQQEVDLALREQRQEEIDLAILLGTIGPVPELVVDRKVLDFKVPDAVATIDKPALFRTAMENRPDRKQAVAQVAQQEAQVTLAERNRWPDISLLVQYQQLGSGDSAPQPPTLSVGLGLPLPLFYQQQGEISRAEADRQSALLSRRRLEMLVVADLESAVNTFSTARRVVERYESALLERAKRARDITQVQFNAGSATLTDLLDAQRSYVAVNSGYYNELVNYWTSVFLLEQAVGKELVR